MEWVRRMYIGILVSALADKFSFGGTHTLNSDILIEHTMLASGTTINPPDRYQVEIYLTAHNYSSIPIV